jgi:anti-sigma regulatory factor (Ser/Thr protein kinase)
MKTMPCLRHSTPVLCQGRHEVQLDVVTDTTAHHVRHGFVDAFRNWGHLLACWPPDHPALTDAAVVLSELVTNVHRHAPGWCRVAAHLHGATLRLTVADTSPLRPVVPLGLPDFEAPRGRGLWIVNSVCESFRFESPDDGRPGKCAVAELQLPGFTRTSDS